MGQKDDMESGSKRKNPRKPTGFGSFFLLAIVFF